MMNSVSNVAHAPALSQYAKAGESAPSSRAPGAESRADEVSLSESALQTLEQPKIRRQLVNAIRAEIAAGTYLTDDKLNAVAGKIAETLRSEEQ